MRESALHADAAINKSSRVYIYSRRRAVCKHSVGDKTLSFRPPHAVPATGITLVPNIEVNYPDWVTGPLDLGNTLFFLLAFKSTHVEKLARKKTGPNVALINDDRCTEINDYSLSFVH